MRRFGTQGRVYPEDNYVVPRTAEVADFINRIKDGKYIVLFAPRQTGKTTFFRLALDVLEAEAPTYFPIQLNFEVYEDYSVSGFYRHLSKMIRAEIEKGFEKRGECPLNGVSTIFTIHNVNGSRFNVRFLCPSRHPFEV